MSTDTTDDVRALRDTSAAASTDLVQQRRPWWTASEWASATDHAASTAEAEHIEACDPARISRVLARLEVLERESAAAAAVLADAAAQDAELQRLRARVAALERDAAPAGEMDHFGYVDAEWHFYQPDLPWDRAQRMTPVYLRPAAAPTGAQA